MMERIYRDIDLYIKIHHVWSNVDLGIFGLFSAQSTLISDLLSFPIIIIIFIHSSFWVKSI